MIGRIVAWWYRRQRDMDMQILWPACVANARNIDHARSAFLLHAVNDRAWQSLGAKRMARIIANLEEPQP